MKSVTRYPAVDLPASLREILQSVSLFASPDFLAVWQTRNGKGVYWCVENDGTLTILPGVEFGTGMFVRFQSLSDGLYSQPISLQGSTIVTMPESHITALLAAIANHAYMKTWVYDYYHSFQNITGFTATACETHVIDITSPTWEPPDATLRSEIRKAERENIQIERFALSRHFDSFLVLMKSTEQRHGRKPKYSTDFFRALAKLAEKDPRIIWKQCTYEGKAAASHIFFVEGKLALHWQVYFDKTFSHLKANQAILIHTIRELQQRGITTLGLGASPPDAEGLRSYKEHWGGKPYQYQCIHRATWLGKLL